MTDFDETFECSEDRKVVKRQQFYFRFQARTGSRAGSHEGFFDFRFRCKDLPVFEKQPIFGTRNRKIGVAPVQIQFYATPKFH